jgi:uncharacterized protein with NAD-binding domain and iron-sulfur cluster
MTKVAVLGGGIGGLTAAHELMERGFEVEVYDLHAIPGGKSRTIPVAGSGRHGRADLPGEHGFRFFPSFYVHLPDTMKRIPYGHNPNGCFDNLVHTTRVEFARYRKTPIVAPSRFPRTPADFALVLRDLFVDVGLRPGELEFFAGRLWEVMTSCDDRRLAELERVSWWDFIEAEGRSEAYQKFLAEGMSRSLVAAKAREGSARTVGQIQVRLIGGLLQWGRGTDRVLNGPTSYAFLNPWLQHLRANGVTYLEQHRVTGLGMRHGRIDGVAVENVATGSRSEVRADYYVAALPVEGMGPLVTAEMQREDPDLANLHRLAKSVRWMNGIQFFLRTNPPIVNGHVLYVDAPWALTSISEPQFWPGLELANFGDGEVRGVLSVDISDWDTPGRFCGKTAKECGSRDEIAREVFQELAHSLNVDGQNLLSDEMVHSWFLDSDIVVHHDGRETKEANLEPLFINRPDSWRLRPPATSQIQNLFLAADYVQTNTDLACMEAANEAARRAVNAILDRDGSAARRCRIWPMDMPAAFAPWRVRDQMRFDAGKPWSGRVF